MKKHFYSHLIEIDSIMVSLATLDISAKEKQELILIVESSVHHLVVDTVLSELVEEDKKIFIIHLAKENHIGLWTFLNHKIHNVEDKIRQAVSGLVSELHQDIEKTKKQKK